MWIKINLKKKKNLKFSDVKIVSASFKFLPMENSYGVNP